MASQVKSLLDGDLHTAAATPLFVLCKNCSKKLSKNMSGKKVHLDIICVNVVEKL